MTGKKKLMSVRMRNEMKLHLNLNRLEKVNDLSELMRDPKRRQSEFSSRSNLASSKITFCHFEKILFDIRHFLKIKLFSISTLLNTKTLINSCYIILVFCP